MNKGRIMRRTHRLRKLRKQRRILRQRFHLRFFYRDKWMAGKMDQFKPKIVVLTGAGISAESDPDIPFGRRAVGRAQHRGCGDAGRLCPQSASGAAVLQ